MLSQSIDLVNEHESQCSGHKIGSHPKSCELCGRYLHLKDDIKNVRKLLKINHERNTTEFSLPKLERKYYYIYVDNGKTLYVIRDKNKVDAKLTVPESKRNNDQPIIISQQRAFQIINLIYGMDGRIITDFLKKDEIFFGIVGRSNVKGELLKASRPGQLQWLKG